MPARAWPQLRVRPAPPAARIGTAPVRNAIAVVDDTGCSVGKKQDTAIAKGAVGLLIVSAPGATGRPDPALPQTIRWIERPRTGRSPSESV